MIICAIALYLLAGTLRVATAEPAVFVPAAIVCLVVGMTGLLRLMSGLAFSPEARVLLAGVMLVPLAGLLMLALVSERATKTLRAAGYEVGLLGARTPRRTKRALQGPR